MQVLVGGMPAKPLVSTLVWQKRQSMPSSETWCLWLKGTGCSSGIPAHVTQGERYTPHETSASAGSPSRTPTIEARERRLVTSGKTCGIGAT
jgi:hypothetical protein